MTTPPFDFFPRNLTKKSRVGPGAKTRVLTRDAFLKTRAQDEACPGPSTSTHKVSQLSSDEVDLRVLLELSLSDHALWSNEELLQAMYACSEAYIPIRYLVKFSPYLNTYMRKSGPKERKTVLPSESTFLRCARASDLLECRMIVTEPSWSFTRIEDGSGLGGIEVRRKDWTKVREHLRRLTTFYWDSRTVYVDNLPPTCRNFSTTHSLVRNLLQSRDGDTSGSIQSISFPAHRDDSADTLPSKNKGFAFIVLISSKLCDALLARWPWDYASSQEQVINSGGNSNMSKLITDARDFGFRCMSKKRWEVMKREYLDLQQKLLQRTVAASSRSRRTPCQAQLDATQGFSLTPALSADVPPSPMAHVSTEKSLDYPLDCLVFVKNIHPETNKTTLKALFSAAIGVKADAIDYVDYTKGLDSCYLRLTSPAHAQAISAHFSSSRLAHNDALSHVCKELASGSSQSPVSVDVVQGRREEMYWQKVPENVKKMALAKVAAGGGEDRDVTVGEGDGVAGKKRKRQR